MALIRVKNNKDRKYNGIGFQKIVSIDEKHLQTYLDAGFVKFMEQEKPNIAPSGDAGKTEPTNAELREKLKILGFDAPSNMSKAKLLAKIEELAPSGDAGKTE